MSKRAIEAFVVPVLPGTARMDTDRLDMDFSQSFLQQSGLEFAAVVHMEAYGNDFDDR